VERPQQASPEQLPHNQELEDVRRQNEEYKLENEELRRVIKDMQGERSGEREGAEREAFEKWWDAEENRVMTAKEIARVAYQAGAAQSDYLANRRSTLPARFGASCDDTGTTPRESEGWGEG
jgi:hypothetical protein